MHSEHVPERFDSTPIAFLADLVLDSLACIEVRDSEGEPGLRLVDCSERIISMEDG